MLYVNRRSVVQEGSSRENLKRPASHVQSQQDVTQNRDTYGEAPDPGVHSTPPERGAGMQVPGRKPYSSSGGGEPDLLKELETLSPPPTPPEWPAGGSIRAL